MQNIRDRPFLTALSELEWYSNTEIAVIIGAISGSLRSLAEKRVVYGQWWQGERWC
ncbi:hypothetical protein M404DRAFT_995797 [Pisolithus tinctorius Marx 270]|uniref:Uncharacterized protein n=1 Tax=Pisolithus tinctorius Marx 270 TaxID=870435 RepID=A0A0C3PAF2_PISTI|nr:hypothetical protein M404DRAFT_995797 [Pisolithus tinctorius Marx 270]